MKTTSQLSQQQKFWRRFQKTNAIAIYRPFLTEMLDWLGVCPSQNSINLRYCKENIIQVPTRPDLLYCGIYVQLYKRKLSWYNHPMSKRSSICFFHEVSVSTLKFSPGSYAAVPSLVVLSAVALVSLSVPWSSSLYRGSLVSTVLSSVSFGVKVVPWLSRVVVVSSSTIPGKYKNDQIWRLRVQEKTFHLKYMKYTHYVILFCHVIE